MVDPVSVTIGVGVSVVSILAAGGLYLAGRAPDHIINVREVETYERRTASIRALRQDIRDGEDEE